MAYGPIGQVLAYLRSHANAWGNPSGGTVKSTPAPDDSTWTPPLARAAACMARERLLRAPMGIAALIAKILSSGRSWRPWCAVRVKTLVPGHKGNRIRPTILKRDIPLRNLNEGRPTAAANHGKSSRVPSVQL